MPGWALVLILMILCGFTGMVVGYVLGVENPPDDREDIKKK